MREMILESLNHPSTYILGGGTLGGGLGLLYSRNDAKLPYLTQEEKNKRELANVLLGSIYGTGIGATTYALRQFLKDRE